MALADAGLHEQRADVPLSEAERRAGQERALGVLRQLCSESAMASLLELLGRGAAIITPDVFLYFSSRVGGTRCQVCFIRL